MPKQRKNKKQLPYLTGLLRKLGPKIGAKVVIEPEWKVVGQIIYPNGIVRAFHFYSMDLNPLASAKIAKDKHFAKFFIKKNGYPVAEGQTFFEKSWAEKMGSNRDILFAVKYAHKSGYPLIVKPNDQSQGENVVLVHTSQELTRALKEIFKFSKVAIVEKYMPGRDYRIVVLKNEVISAYERTPLSITGDGKNSVSQLLKNKQEYFNIKGRDTKINFLDTRIRTKLKKSGYSLKSILPAGIKVFLLDNSNLSTGGDGQDVTGGINSGFKKIAVGITKKMGLHICGVDLMITKGDITQDPKNCKYYIIEINAAPGLDHYVTTGPAQKKIVERMYLKILQALGKKD